jgi:hypothetical protein
MCTYVRTYICLSICTLHRYIYTCIPQGRHAHKHTHTHTNRVAHIPAARTLSVAAGSSAVAPHPLFCLPLLCIHYLELKSRPLFESERIVRSRPVCVCVCVCVRVRVCIELFFKKGHVCVQALYFAWFSAHGAQFLLCSCHMCVYICMVCMYCLRVCARECLVQLVGMVTRSARTSTPGSCSHTAACT